MSDPTGNSLSNSISSLTSDEQGQVIAALTVAVKGKVCMHAPCPKCGLAKRLFEKIFADGSIRHECKSCGYFMVWHAREPITPAIRRANLDYYEAITGRVHPDQRNRQHYR